MDRVDKDTIIFSNDNSNFFEINNFLLIKETHITEANFRADTTKIKISFTKEKFSELCELYKNYKKKTVSSPISDTYHKLDNIPKPHVSVPNPKSEQNTTNTKVIPTASHTIALIYTYIFRDKWITDHLQKNENKLPEISITQENFYFNKQNFDKIKTEYIDKWISHGISNMEGEQPPMWLLAQSTTNDLTNSFTKEAFDKMCDWYHKHKHNP